MAIHNDYPNLFTYLGSRLYDLDVLCPSIGAMCASFTVIIYDGEGHTRETYAIADGPTIEHCFERLDAWAATQL